MLHRYPDVWNSHTVLSRSPPPQDSPRPPRPRAARDDVAKTRSCVIKFVNDPSAGSPTETLLRLLLPLDDTVRLTSQLTEDVVAHTLGSDP